MLFYFLCQKWQKRPKRLNRLKIGKIGPISPKFQNSPKSRIFDFFFAKIEKLDTFNLILSKAGGDNLSRCACTPGLGQFSLKSTFPPKNAFFGEKMDFSENCLRPGVWLLFFYFIFHFRIFFGAKKSATWRQNQSATWRQNQSAKWRQKKGKWRQKKALNGAKKSAK